ncbi:MAG: PA domain-containing protein [Flavobacteriia bacterium]|jgi:hypothetical protein
MKKTLLFIAAIVSGFVAYSQSVVLGISPAAVEGSYDHTWADPAGGWATPDFNIPNTYVQGELMLVEDGSAGTNAQGHPISQEGCNELTNDLTGKIAVIYRNTCNFSIKALNAQTAGAIGVIIINRDPEVIPMGAGTDGANVTIPTVMLTALDGAALVDEMANGAVVVFIGNKVGQFANDAAIYSDGAMISKSTGVLSQLAQNGSEFGFDIGVQLFNDGSATQSNITVNAKVTNPTGTEVYNNTITVASLAAADSVYLYPGEAQSFPAFSLSSYPAGRYTLTYTVGLEVNDEFPSDNVITSAFVVNDSLFSYSALNSVNNLPAGTGGYQPSTLNSTYGICSVISDPNASRIGAEGMYFALVTNAADSIDLTGEEIALNLYEWGDVFTDLNDANLAFDVLTPVAFGYYYYPSNLADSMVYGAFTTPVLLENNKRYLACAQTVNLNVFFRYDTDIDYTTNVNNYLQPLFPVEADGAYSAGGFGSDNAPAMAVKVFNAAELGVSEASMIEGVAYPNPAVDNVTVSLKAEGNANITMTDVAGRVVLSKTANLVNGKTDLNIAALNAGVYVVNVVLESGKAAQFNVVKK